MRHFITANFNSALTLSETLSQLAALQLELKNTNACPHDLLVFLSGDIFHGFCEIQSEIEDIGKHGILDASRFGIHERLTARQLHKLIDVNVREMIDLEEDAEGFYIQLKALADEFGDDQIVFVALDSGDEVTKIGDFS